MKKPMNIRDALEQAYCSLKRQEMKTPELPINVILALGVLESALGKEKVDALASHLKGE